MSSGPAGSGSRPFEVAILPHLRDADINPGHADGGDFGGIPEIVVQGETGYLVDYNSDDTETFTTELAGRINELLTDNALARKMGKAGRRRVLDHFGWPAIAARTVELYDSLRPAVA